MVIRRKTSRGWDRRGWRAPLVRVLCSVRRHRGASMWRTARGTRPPACHAVTETGGTQRYGSVAFGAARAHVGAGR